MRFIKILSVFALVILSKFATGQLINLETVTFPFAPKDNGVILLNSNQPTTIYSTFTVSRALSATSNTWPDLPIKAEIALYIENATILNTLIDVVNVSNSDWFGPNYAASKVIEKEIVIPAGTVTLANRDKTILVRFRFYKEGYPSPYNTNGWTDWVDKALIPVKLNPNQIPQTAFTGPNSVCDEGVYTITNPYTVSLENATGIATLTALGNNQWKVTKTNSLGGVVVLKSQLGTTSFTKSIKIDPSYLDGIINGPVMIKQTDADLNFVFEPSNNEVDFTDLIWSTNNPYVKLNKVNETTATLTFLPGFNIPSGQTNLNLEVTASKSNSCGIISATSIIKVRK